ncbi:MAG: Unknown protein [uncultured Sulfurovum sp.]|uniref:Uncharacterized protein n=1 Tax=uncultured Sulfurovum sp. TaxID=269237 RepID=A0A6S6SK96_9BACT|nr:MAG: Unknown protein [uncultured Sulfurovum sp.]
MKIIILMLLSIFFLRADEALTELFQTLSKTPQEQKYKVINEIKTHIIQLKQQERVEAIKVFQKEKKLQEELPKTPTVTVVNDDKEPSTHEMSMDMEMSMEMTMDMSSHMQNMSNMENMLQMQEMRERREMREQPNMPTPMTPNEPKTPSSPRNSMPTSKK